MLSVFKFNFWFRPEWNFYSIGLSGDDSQKGCKDRISKPNIQRLIAIASNFLFALNEQMCPRTRYLFVVKYVILFSPANLDVFFCIEK
ncbi:MAG: hypothetical protein EA361_12735 [Bacteroidetes bacterium]|nr:MAG: hypothetical protein EA361_12735 [Bacteroidota bacterium]